MNLTIDFKNKEITGDLNTWFLREDIFKFDVTDDKQQPVKCYFPANRKEFFDHKYDVVLMNNNKVNEISFEFVNERY
jgi:hypothetical protein